MHRPQLTIGLEWFLIGSETSFEWPKGIKEHQFLFLNNFGYLKDTEVPRRPTKAVKACEGTRRPTKARECQQRPGKAQEGLGMPRKAREGMGRPMKASDDPSNNQTYKYRCKAMDQ